MTDPNCVFCKIARGQIPAKKIYDDDEVMAFHDIRPQAAVHFLLVPKAHVATLYDAGPAHQAALGKMLPPPPPPARGAGGGAGVPRPAHKRRGGGREGGYVSL